MVLVELALVDDLRAGAAHVGGGAGLAVAVSAEQLAFDRNRKRLVARHGVRIGRMQHGAAIAKRPCARIPRRLLAHEAVFDHQAVVRERILIEEVSELAVEALVLVVSNLEQSVFDAEGVAEIVAEIVFGDLRRPALQILAIE